MRTKEEIYEDDDNEDEEQTDPIEGHPPKPTGK